MKLRIAGIINDSIVDGPGIRLTVFTQGCKHNCKGCHNVHTHSLDGGYEIDIEEIYNKVKENPLLEGITLSGGEPFLQTVPLIELTRSVKALGLNVIAYTGYVWEDIIKNPQLFSLAREVDYIIDGPFILEQKSLMLNFRGSKNQRIIDVNKSIELGKAVEVEL